ncbi:MAG: hypothetical protein AB3N63_12140 [Puniceicoccaceae bacterium]
MSDVSLSAGIRSNLLQLQSSAKLFNRTTGRLASGKKVDSAIDNPTNFFAAVNLSDRSTGLSARLDGMGQAVQTIKAADNGISTIRSFVSSMKGIANTALGTSDAAERNNLGRQFNELIKQVGTVVADSGYQGINLLEGEETQTVQFNETFDESTMDVKGFDIGAGAVATTGAVGAAEDVDGATSGTEVTISGSSGGVAGAALIIGNQDDGTLYGVQGAGITATAGDTSAVGGASVDWGADNYKTVIQNVVQDLEVFDAQLKKQASNLAQNLATITIREDFTNELVNTLSEGADKLTLADLNEEGANLLALQTSSQLATQSLSLASQQSQGVLQLLG